jgi:hypothetical protein
MLLGLSRSVDRLDPCGPLHVTASTDTMLLGLAILDPHRGADRPPFTADVMVSKMDSCMMDLVAFHSHPAPGAVDVEVDATEQPALTARGSGRIGDRRSRKEAGGGFEGRPSEGFLSTMRRTLSSRLSSRYNNK